MRARSLGEIGEAHATIERVKRLSDRILGIGPINIIGLDGLLSLIPVVGTVYSVGASLIILSQGVRAHATPGTTLIAFLILLVDSGITTVGDLTKLVPGLNLITGGADVLFQGHLYAAHIFQKDIEKTHYVEASLRQSYQNGDHVAHKAEMKATKGKKRIVYLRR